MNSINRVNGMKVVKKWNLGLLFSLLFMILAIGGTIAALWFLPLTKINITTSSQRLISGEIYASDFVYFLFQNFLGVDSIHAGFWYFKDYALGNLFNGNLESIGYIFIYTISVLELILVLFALISVIIFLCGLIFGVILDNWKAMKVMTWLTFAFMFILTAIIVSLKLVFMFMLVGAAIPGGSETIAACDLDVWTAVIILAGLLIFGIVEFIIYVLAFKDRIYIKDAKRILEAQKQKQEMMQQQMAAYPMMPMFMGTPNYQMSPSPLQNPAPLKSNPTIVTQVKYSAGKGLPEQLSSIGGHAFSQNSNLEIAIIPLGIKEIGPSAFSNCPNLKVVSIPTSVTKIGYNAFFGCKKLARINYGGRKNEWKNIVRGSNWLASSGTSIVVCVDGAITVNPYH